MKLVKKASGKTTVKMSRAEWTDMGKKAGWLSKSAKWNFEKGGNEDDDKDDDKDENKGDKKSDDKKDDKDDKDDDKEDNKPDFLKKKDD